MNNVLLKNCTVIDGTKQMNVIPNVDILIEDGNIKKIGSNLSSNYKKIDLNGKYVTPGLINLHVHLPGSGKVTKKKAANKQKLVKLITENPLMKKVGISLCGSFAKSQVLSGTTTIRTVGGISDIDTILRDQINAGKRLGPRILASNNAVGPKDCHMEGTVAFGAETNEEAVKLVQKQIATGVDTIKLMITGGILDAVDFDSPGDLKMNGEMVKACCDEAHKHGLKVCAHVEGIEGMEVAILNGVDTIEHGSLASNELLEKLKSRNGAVVCTLSPAMPLAYLDKKDTGYDDNIKHCTKVFMNRMIENVNNCLSMGVQVGLGTDTACPMVTQYDMWRELVYFRKCIKDATNESTLHLATLGNAKIIGIDNITGSVEVGKSADLIVLDNNPLDDLSALRNPKLVVFKGKVIKKKNKKMKNIDQLLDKVIESL